jgi:acetyl-CoA acetyltransferase
VPDKTGDELAIEAARAALQDCGLKKDDIDGLFVQPSHGHQGDYLNVGLMLGLNPRVGGAVEASGASGCYMIQHAALLLYAGMAHYVLLVYGTNQKTNRNRFGGALLEEHAPYGAFNPSLPFALAFRRHMHLYGTTEEQLATVAITQRAHAGLNPKAVLRTPITLDDYMSARYIVAPLRLFDYCYITDGGHAFVLTTAERARDLRKPPAYLRGFGRQEAFRAYETPDLMMQSFQQQRAASMVFPMAEGRNPPTLDSFVVDDGRHARVALDIALEIEFVRDELQIPLDFRLAREMLAPLPLVEQFLRKGVLVRSHHSGAGSR